MQKTNVVTEKKTYQTPQVVELGSVESMTQGVVKCHPKKPHCLPVGSNCPTLT